MKNLQAATAKAKEFGYTTKVWNNQRLYINTGKQDLCYIDLQSGAVVMLMDWPRQYHKDEAAEIANAYNSTSADQGAAIGNEIGCFVPNNAREIAKAHRLGFDYIEA